MTKVVYTFPSSVVANEFMQAVDKTSGRAVGTPCVARQPQGRGTKVIYTVLVGLFAAGADEYVDKLAHAHGGAFLETVRQYPHTIFHQGQRKAA